MGRTGAIIDLDGTLLDSIEAWHALDRNFLEKYGIMTPENLDAMSNSSTIEFAAEYLVGIGFHLPFEEIVAEINGMIANAYRRELQLFPGAREFLELQRRAGVALALLTAAPRALVMACLERLQIAEIFDVIICDADKHRPEPFIQAAETLHVEICDTTVYDDQSWVLATAEKLGFKIASKIN